MNTRAIKDLVLAMALPALCAVWLAGCDMANITEAKPVDVTVEPLSIDYGEVALGQSVERTFTIRNGSSMSKLTGTVRHVGAGFLIVVGGDPFVIQPGSIRIITVRFSPQSAGEHNGRAIVSHNQGPEISVQLTGKGGGSHHD